MPNKKLETRYSNVKNFYKFLHFFLVLFLSVPLQYIVKERHWYFYFKLRQKETLNKIKQLLCLFGGEEVSTDEFQPCTKAALKLFNSMLNLWVFF